MVPDKTKARNPLNKRWQQEDSKVLDSEIVQGLAVVA